MTIRDSSSVLKLAHPRYISPLLALFSLQLNYIFDIVLSQSSRAIVNMRAALSQLWRILDAAVDLLASQLQDPEVLVILEEQASSNGDLTGSR